MVRLQLQLLEIIKIYLKKKKNFFSINIFIFLNIKVHISIYIFFDIYINLYPYQSHIYINLYPYQNQLKRKKGIYIYLFIFQYGKDNYQKS